MPETRQREVYYSESDGRPLAVSDFHFEVIIDLIHALQAHYVDVAADIRVSATQLSRPALAEWFDSYRTPILVTETIRVPVGRCLVEQGRKAVATAAR